MKDEQTDWQTHRHCTTAKAAQQKAAALKDAGAKSPYGELSLPGTLVPWNIRSLELLSYPRNFRSLQLSHHGNFTIPHFLMKKLYPGGAHRHVPSALICSLVICFSFAISAIINQFIGYSCWNLVSFRGSPIPCNRQPSLIEIRQIVLELSCSQTHSQTHRHTYVRTDESNSFSHKACDTAVFVQAAESTLQTYNDASCTEWWYKTPSGSKHQLSASWISTCLECGSAGNSSFSITDDLSQVT